MAAIQYARLYPDTTQLQAKDGHNLTAGWVMVFLAGTDDPATTYADFNGTVNPQKIVIDDNGRFCAIVDKAKAYRVEVYDSEGMLQWTTEPVWCTGNAGSGMSVTEVVSTDGSIAVESSVAGSLRTYDLSIAPDNVRELLEWAKCYNTVESDGVVYPLYSEGTMQTFVGQGLEVVQDRFYHLTNKITVIPSGNGINYETLTVQLVHDDGQGTTVALCTHDFDIDNSVSDKVELEFSEDIIPDVDGFLFWRVTNSSPFENVSLDLQIHRIFSGINAVPGSIASKTWVEQNISSKIDYSALEYSPQNLITGISGSAIAGGIDASTVSSIASSYAESAISSISGWSGDFSSISSKIDWSSSGVFQPSGDYAYNSSLSGYIPTSASGQFQLSGDYAYNSSLSSKVDQSAFDDCCSAVHSALDDKLDKSASGQFAPSGDYAYNSSLSDYIPTSASGMFQPSGDYQSAGDYAFNSSVSSKLDASASGDFVLNSSFSSYSSNVGDTINNMSSSITSIENNITSIENNLTSISSDVSGKVDESAMSAWIPYSALDYSGTAISGIGGSSLAGMGGGGADYTGVAPVNVDNDTRLISVDHRTLCVDSTMTAYNSGSSAVLGVNVAGLDLSSKMDASASSLFYPTDNPSGFISGVDLTPYQTTAGMTAYQEVSAMTAYQPVGAYIYESALGWAEV